MNLYLLLRLAHIVCVIVWLGTTTTLALLAAYGSVASDRALNDRLPALARWFGPRVIGPSSMGTLASGILLAVVGHLGFSVPWVVLALATFAAASLVSVGVRLPATVWRQRAVAAGHGHGVQRADRLLLGGSLLELVVLYLGVVDMVLKPMAYGAGWLLAGAVVLALAGFGVWLAAVPSPAGAEGRSR